MKYGFALIYGLLNTMCIITSAGAKDHYIPTAAFSATTVCQGLPTVFTNNSATQSGSIIASIWDFGDGQGSSVLNPSHTFASSGIFSVTLTVIDSQGDVDDFTDIVTVHPSGTLNFVIGSVNKCVSSTFSFTNLSNIPSGNFTSYTWNFGDGSPVDHNISPSHQYTAHGTYQITLSTITDHNCNNTFTKTLEVYPEAAVNFTALNVCQDKELPFTNLTTVASGLVGYTWTFGDAATSSEVNPKHQYATPGDFLVNLKATTEKGCVTNLSKQVTAHPVPAAFFTAAEPCLGSSTSFINQSTITSGMLSHTWDFGDGSTSATEAPDHLYTATGNFKVTLITTSVPGCKSTQEKYLHVIPKATVNFSFKDVCFGQKAEFINNTTIDEGDVVLTWDFGDGVTSHAVSPVHDYTAFGTYNVKLSATTPGGGCETNLIKPISIKQQPKALFEAKDNCLDSLIVFKNKSQFQGTDISYAWEFGDGRTSADKEPTHQYLSSQTYQVVLRANAVNGCTDSFFLPVKVSPLPLVNFIADNVCDTHDVIFKNFTTIASGTMTYTWNFADGHSSVDPEPSHLYTGPGKYKIKVTATSEQGCATIKEKEVIVYPMPATDFQAPPACDNHPVIFKNTTSVASGEINSFTWNFGDDTNSIVTNPSKKYLREGTYIVKLIAKTDRGCERSKQKEVIVYPPAIAAFSVKDVCSQEAIKITNTSTVSKGSLTYQWDFGDQSGDVSTSPSHQYATYGVYTIKLVATSDTGCKDSVNHAVAIFGVPQVNAGVDQTVSKGYAVQLNAFGGNEYQWEPIDGLSNSTIANPLATPLTTTEYTVVVTDRYGCQNSDKVIITVNDDFKLMASNVFTPDGNGKNDTWVIDNVATFGDVHVRVYNRWGKLVFSQQAYQNDWTGISGGDALPDGTYYYFLTFDSSDKLYKGAVTIMRNKQ